MEFEFSTKAKITTGVLMLIGVISMLMGGIEKLWTNLLINGFFFFAIALAGSFFIGLQYVTEAAYATTLKRVFEAVAGFLPVGAIIIFIVLLGATMHWNHIYHWMAPETYNEYVLESSIGSHHPEYAHEMTDGFVKNEKFDKIIAKKRPYLNNTFFWVRSLIYLIIPILYVRTMRKRSLAEDAGEGDEKSWFKRNQVLSAAFIVFFGYTSSTLSWDWIMSIDTHWFSTLFGWYVFSGMWVGFVLSVLFIAYYLKNKGLLAEVNENHLGDMGKWMFGISFLWTYLWFSQFMLIWYSDIPEEVTYFVTRIEHYKGLFFGIMLINFIFPMVILMSRDAKRSPLFVIPVGVIIFIGHWLDTYLLIVPGVHGTHAHLGLADIGTALGFLGLFIFVVFTNLSKAPLVVKRHAYLDEAKHLHN